MTSARVSLATAGGARGRAPGVARLAVAVSAGAALGRRVVAVSAGAAPGRRAAALSAGVPLDR